MEFIYSKNVLISQKYLFWGYWISQQIKQSAPGLNRGLLTNFWRLKSANYVKFTELYVMCTKRHVLAKNNVFSKWVKNWICHKFESKRFVESKHIDSPVKKKKKKIPRTANCKRIIIIIIILLRVSHTSDSRWFLTGVWVTASLLKSLGPFSVFWPILVIYSSNDLDSFSYFRTFLTLCQSFGYCTKCTNYNWYLHYFHVT